MQTKTLRLIRSVPVVTRSRTWRLGCLELVADASELPVMWYVSTVECLPTHARCATGITSIALYTNCSRENAAALIKASKLESGNGYR